MFVRMNRTRRQVFVQRQMFEQMSFILRFEASLMTLLLLGSCVCVGLSDDGYYEEFKKYGSLLRLRLNINAHSILFIPMSNPYQKKILWNRDSLSEIEEGRGRFLGISYVISNLTEADSGLYIVRNRDQKELYKKSVDVKAHTATYIKSPGESFSFSFDLEPSSCNIYFYPDCDSFEHNEIVTEGRLKEYKLHMFLDFVKPCGIFVERLHMPWCSGMFHIRDRQGHLAMEGKLYIQSTGSNYKSIGLGVAVSLLFSCCVRCFCCKKSTKKSRSNVPQTTAADDTAAAEPAVQYYEYETEPAGPRKYQSSHSTVTLHPSRADTSTGLLGTAAEEQRSAPALDLSSDSVPRFELKGVNFLSDVPLSSASVSCDVYTSDKLKFPSDPAD
ncbi:uncharacterized protein LOC117520643 isoform X2 [Thalassophryne amazonica]|uniref:uncharacterized protein LOC117520643 isoform X2 n=1 Tax=Thalassophryne amazonica TaxID=390379 RepID=UPI00147086B6|nr:uncharacterized protein LOC117520643 isoform X2 [Thalassophryne amazonica]